MIIYLLIGLLWVASLDIIIKTLKIEATMSNVDRVVISLFWPITIIVFTYYFIQTFRGK